MGATSEFRRDIENIRLYYLSTLEAYNSSFDKIKNGEFDTVKVSTTPKKSFNISNIDVNYYVMRDVHLRLMKSNQEVLRLNTLVSLMACLEKYLKGVMRIAFRSAPKLFSNVKSNFEMDFGSVIRYGNYSNLTSHYLEKEVRRIGEKSLRETGDYFKKHFGIDFQSLGVRWERLLEASKSRNVIVHADARQIDDQGVLRKVQLSHWFIMQIIDDMYDLSIFVGKSMKMKINEHSNLGYASTEPKAILLYTVDSSYFAVADEFKGNFRFLVDNTRVMQLSDLGDIISGRIEDKTMILVQGSVKIISAYVNEVRSRMKKIRDVHHRYDYIYWEDSDNPVASAGIINAVVDMLSTVEDENTILERLTGDGRAISVIKFAIDVAKNLPSQATLMEIGILYDRKYQNSPIEYSIGELAEYFMLPRKIIWASLIKIKVESIKRRLELAHLSI